MDARRRRLVRSWIDPKLSCGPFNNESGLAAAVPGSSLIRTGDMLDCMDEADGGIRTGSTVSKNSFLIGFMRRSPSTSTRRYFTELPAAARWERSPAWAMPCREKC
jgi:hypothetical protein